jgi:hypothetical protein
MVKSKYVSFNPKVIVYIPVKVHRKLTKIFALSDRQVKNRYGKPVRGDHYVKLVSPFSDYVPSMRVWLIEHLLYQHRAEIIFEEVAQGILKSAKRYKKRGFAQEVTG